MGEELYEHETSTAMTREQAAAKLRELADSLERHNQVRITHGDREVVVPVGDQVDYEFEVEIEPGKKSEIEVTISW